MIQKFTHGNRGTRDRLNEIVDAVNRLDREKPGLFMSPHNMSSGRVAGVALNQLRPRIPRLALGANGAGAALIAHWPFSSADGDEDIAGQGYDGTFAGNANTDYDVLQLDGTGDYVNLDAHVASLRTINQGTISFWMNPTAWMKVMFSLAHGAQPLTDGAFYLEYAVAMKKIRVYCYGILSATFEPPLAYNRWHHITYVSDATGNAVYIDGAVAAGTYGAGTAATQAFLGDATPDSDAPADTMRIGELYYNSTSYGNWQGAIADFRIYNRGLTHAEIIDIYQGTNRYIIHANEMSGACRIFAVVSEDTGDGVYNCHEQTLDATEWDDTAGDSKVDNHNTTSVEVLNLAEFDPEATYVVHLLAGDLLLAFRHWDDEAGFRWVGVPFFQDSNQGYPKVAYVKTTPTGTTIDVYLTTDGTGTLVEGVICHQAGTQAANDIDLDECIPRLTDGDMVTVYKERNGWYCTTIFQPINHAKGLRIVGEKLEVNIDTTQMQFDAGDDDQLKTNLDACP